MIPKYETVVDETGVSKPPAAEQIKIDKLKNGETVLINASREFHVLRYAMENKLLTPIERKTPLGNPFRIGRDGSRDEVMDKFREHFDEHPELKTMLMKLKGRVLACHCLPHRCHGEYLLEVIYD